MLFYDEFAIDDRPSLYYAWAERNSKPEIPSDEKWKRNKVNGMMSVDAVTGEIYLQLQPKSKTEDVAMYFADLCKDAQAENIEKVSFVLDNNSTHKDKMKRLLQEHLHRLGLTDKITVEFLHTPPYSPDFNLAEYEIHLLRLLKLHHLPANVTIPNSGKRLESDKSLFAPAATCRMEPDQISKTLDHIFALASMSIS